MNTSDLHRARDAAVEAARRAAAHIRERASVAADLDRRRKDRNDYVTQVDERAQAIILDVLGEAFPAWDALAEEGADLQAAAARVEAPRWIIDPIDGTTNFMHGASPYAVSIGLQCEARIDVGVVLDVPAGDLYTAVRGGGAYCNGAPIATSPAQTMRDALVTTGFPYRTFDHLPRYTEVLQSVIREAQGVRRPGAASVDLARVAAGAYGAFFETGLSPWDVAAGTLLVEEAGGRVTDYHGRGEAAGGADGGFLFGRQIVATGGPLHDRMLALVAPMKNVRA